jgi:hypothetical protein
LDDPYEGPGISTVKTNLIYKKYKNISAVILTLFTAIQTLDLDPDPP